VDTPIVSFVGHVTETGTSNNFNALLAYRSVVGPNVPVFVESPSIASFGSPAINNGGDIAFKEIIPPVVPQVGVTAIVLARPNSEFLTSKNNLDMKSRAGFVPQVVLTAGEAKNGYIFNDFNSIAMNNNRKISFWASVCFESAPATCGTGIFLASPNGSNYNFEALALDTSLQPDSRFDFFLAGDFQNTAINNNNKVAVLANRTQLANFAIYLLESGKEPTEVVTDGDIADTGTVNDLQSISRNCLNDRDEITFSSVAPKIPATSTDSTTNIFIAVPK
jgi:hypothetical protein